MNALTWVRRCLLLYGLVVPGQGLAQARDGQRDFDFEIGTWKTHLSRLVHPLTGSTTWVEYEGTTVVRTVWNGKANLVELEVAPTSCHFEQAFSDDGGKTWEVNWIATDTRVDDESDKAH
jgi:hypothetical protein